MRIVTRLAAAAYLLLGTAAPGSVVTTVAAGSMVDPPLAAHLSGAALLADPAPAASPSGPRRNAPASGQAVKPFQWAPDYQAHMNVDGQTVAASVFTSADFRALLLVPVSGSSAYLFSLLAKTVATVPLKAIQEDGRQALVTDTPAPAGAFTEDGSTISFHSGAITIQITPEAPLIGEATVQAILQRKPEYAAIARAYEPDAGPMKVLRTWSQPVEITVFFGTWCPVCRKRVPLLMKIVDDAKNPNLHVRYIAIDPDFTTPRQELYKYDVHVTPSFIVSSGGRELGRVNKTPPQSLEASLAAILTNH